MKFLNMHILHPIPYSNLNRDDMGSPKQLSYGGVRRARLSSQALKRAARISFETSSGESTYRSKFIERRLAEFLEEAMAGLVISDEEKTKIFKAAKNGVGKLVAKDVKDDSESSDTLIWLAEEEVQEVAKAALLAGGVSDEKFVAELITGGTPSLAIAAFGRMFASAPEAQTAAASQVAHAFTTHAIPSEVDYFTAVDDLRGEYLHDAGSGHLDVAEYTSGVFYRYMNLDREQLWETWKGTGDGTEKKRLEALFAALLLSLPSGKVNATAPLTLPAMILLVESTSPVSFAPAFETPVHKAPEGGFLTPSLESLENFYKQASKAVPGLFGVSAQFVLGRDSRNIVELSQLGADWALSGKE